MEFLHPKFLWLLLALLLPVLLYLLRRRAKQVDVSTLIFFKTLAKEHQESAWLRKLKKWLSFALTVAVLIASIFALARLVPRAGADGDYRTYIMLVDRSASMGIDAQGAGSGDLLARAKSLLKERLQSIPEEAGVALVAYDTRAEVVQPRTLIRRDLLAQLDQLQVRPIAGDRQDAMDTAERLAGLETPALILHASDQVQSGEEVALPDGVTLETVDLSLAEVSNVGITAFQVRPTPLERDTYDVYAQVALNSGAAAAVPVHLEWYVGGVPSQVRDFELEPGEKETFEFRVRGAGGQVLRMNLSAEGDHFPLDDTVIAPLPEPRPVVAVWIRDPSSQDAYTGLALRAIQESGTLELLAGAPDSWPLEHPVDAVIFDGWLPEQWPEDVPVVVINPPNTDAPIRSQRLSLPVPYDAVRVGNGNHPVLFRVSSSRVAISQTALLEPAGSFEPLWFAGKEPVLLAGEVKGQRIVVMAFSPQQSERLPLTASFPLLLGNSLLWASEPSDAVQSRVRDFATGELVPVSGDTITWTRWDGTQLRRITSPLEAQTIELTQPGIWQTSDGQVGTSHLLSVAESDLPVVAEAEQEGAGQSEVGRAGWGSLTRWLLIAVVVILVVESFLFHRMAVY